MPSSPSLSRDDDGAPVHVPVLEKVQRLVDPTLEQLVGLREVHVCSPSGVT